MRPPAADVLHLDVVEDVGDPALAVTVRAEAVFRDPPRPVECPTGPVIPEERFLLDVAQILVGLAGDDDVHRPIPAAPSPPARVAPRGMNGHLGAEGAGLSRLVRRANHHLVVVRAPLVCLTLPVVGTPFAAVFVSRQVLHRQPAPLGGFGETLHRADGLVEGFAHVQSSDSAVK